MTAVVSDDLINIKESDPSYRKNHEKNPIKIGFLSVLMNYRPAAVEQFLFWAHEKHGDVIEYHWKSNIISVGNHDLASLLLKHPSFQRKGTFTETVTILNPFSLVSISGPDWTRAHWLMVRAMGRLSIENMCSFVKESVRKLVCSLPSDNLLDLYEFTKKVTLDAMMYEVFGPTIDEIERQIVHSGIDSIIAELQGLTQTSSLFRENRKRLDSFVDAKLNAEQFQLDLQSGYVHGDSTRFSVTAQPERETNASSFDANIIAEHSFLRALLDQNTSNNRSPTKASQTPFSLVQLRDLIINVLLFMGTINPAEASVHAVIEIFRSKWSIAQRDLWIETKNLIGSDNSQNRDAGFSRVLRESLRLFPPVAGLSFNRRATADAVIDGWSFKKDDNIICSPYVFHLSSKIWGDPLLFRPSRFLQLTSIQSASFMPFSLGARSCPGSKIGSCVATTLLKEILEHIDVFVPLSYTHKRSLRGGAHFHVRGRSQQCKASVHIASIFVRQPSAPDGNAHRIWFHLRDVSVNLELACSQLLPKKLVVSFKHQSKILSLFIIGIQVFLSIVIFQFILAYIFQSSS